MPKAPLQFHIWPATDRDAKSPTIYDVVQGPWRERDRLNASATHPWRRPAYGATRLSNIQLTVAQNNTWLDIAAGGPPDREFYMPTPIDMVELGLTMNHDVTKGLGVDTEWWEIRMEVSIGSGNYTDILRATRNENGFTTAGGFIFRDISADGISGADVRFKVQRQHLVTATRDVNLELYALAFTRLEDD